MRHGFSGAILTRLLSDRLLARRLLAGLLLAGLLSPACSSKQAPPGEEGGPCYSNSTCNAGLVCASGLCVKLPPADGAGPASDVTKSDVAQGDAGPTEPDAGDREAGQTGDGPPGPWDGVRPDLGRADARPTPVDGGGGLCPGGWCQVAAGSFQMGSPPDENCRESGVGRAKETLHQVTLTHPFIIARTEVTQGQFADLMGYNRSSFKTCGESCPVNSVSWDEAAAYCNAVSTAAGLGACYSCQGSSYNVYCAPASAYSGAAIYGCPGYRIPTEAEWEYAARAGTTTALYSGPLADCTGADVNAGRIGWYLGNSEMKIHPVAQLEPNAWGLYDMSGNTWEWTHDWYQEDLGAAQVTDPIGPRDGDEHILRGGSYQGAVSSMRSAKRWYSGLNGSGVGFRCVRSIQ